MIPSKLLHNNLIFHVLPLITKKCHSKGDLLVNNSDPEQPVDSVLEACYEEYMYAQLTPQQYPKQVVT